MTVLSRGARVRRGGRRPGWLLLTALLVLAMGASSALVFTDRVELLKLAVILALWAAVVTAFVSVIYRRQSDVDQARMRDLKLVYDLQLDREISARREYELTVESQLRRELASELRAQAADEVAALRAELGALRTNLEILFDAELSHRPALETERTSTDGHDEWAHDGEGSPADWVSSDRVSAVRREDTSSRHEDDSIIDVPEEPLVWPREAASDAERYRPAERYHPADGYQSAQANQAGERRRDSAEGYRSGGTFQPAEQYQSAERYEPVQRYESAQAYQQAGQAGERRRGAHRQAADEGGGFPGERYQSPPQRHARPQEEAAPSHPQPPFGTRAAPQPQPEPQQPWRPQEPEPQQPWRPQEPEPQPRELWRPQEPQPRELWRPQEPQPEPQEWWRYSAPTEPASNASEWQRVKDEGHWLPPGTPGSNWVSDHRQDTADAVNGSTTANRPTSAAAPPTSRHGRHSAASEHVTATPDGGESGWLYGATGHPGQRRHSTEDSGHRADMRVPPPPPTPREATAPNAAPVMSPPPTARHRSAEPTSDASAVSDAPPSGGRSVADLLARLQPGSTGGGRRRRRED